MKKTPEEIEQLKLQSQALKAEKEAKKAAKKAKYGDANATKNLPVVEMRIPWVTTEGMEIDLEKPPWDSYCDALERLWRLDSRTNILYSGEIRRKIIRT